MRNSLKFVGILIAAAIAGSSAGSAIAKKTNHTTRNAFQAYAAAHNHFSRLGAVGEHGAILIQDRDFCDSLGGSCRY